MKNAVSVRGMVALGGLVVAALAIVALVLGVGSDEEGAESETRSDLPVAGAGVAEETRTYLAGDGRVLLQVHAIAVELDPQVDADPIRCESASAKLNELSEPDTIVALAAVVPDDVLAEILLAERAALQAYLVACNGGAVERQHVDELKSVLDTTDIRLSELGVAP